MYYLLFLTTFVSFSMKIDVFGNSDLIIIEAPIEDGYRTRTNFKVYWNVPTMQCRSKGVLFQNLYERYGIIQNRNDDFIGDKMVILYDPGVFPAILKNSSSLYMRNGGVPQEGDLSRHLEAFEELIHKQIDKDFDGIIVINFESWRPIFRQNFGALLPYKNTSYNIERSRHWLWPESWIKHEAIRRFEESARIFMEATVNLTRRLRNRSLSGYYAYPFCFNMSPSNMKSDCAQGVEKENDRLSWLWNDSSALFPSLYLHESFTNLQQKNLITGRLREAARNRKKSSKIFPYFWYKYRDGGFVTEDQLKLSLNTVYKSKADGLILWGSSNDVNTVAKCLKLKEYLENILGPQIASYTKAERDSMPYEAIQQ